MINELREFASLLSKHKGALGDGAQLVRDAANEIENLMENAAESEKNSAYWAEEAEGLTKRVTELEEIARAGVLAELRSPRMIEVSIIVDGLPVRSLLIVNDESSGREDYGNYEVHLFGEEAQLRATGRVVFFPREQGIESLISEAIANLKEVE